VKKLSLAQNLGALYVSEIDWAFHSNHGFYDGKVTNSVTAIPWWILNQKY